MKQQDLIIIGVVGAIAAVYLYVESKKPPEVPVLVARGKFSHIERHTKYENEYTWAGNHLNKSSVMRGVSCIHFEDGRSYDVGQISDCPFIKGQEIVISQFKNGSRTVQVETGV